MKSPTVITMHGGSSTSGTAANTKPLAGSSSMNHSQTSVPSLKTTAYEDDANAIGNSSVPSAFGDYFAPAPASSAMKTIPPLSPSNATRNDADKSSHPWSNLFAIQQTAATPAVSDSHTASTPLHFPFSTGSDTFTKNGLGGTSDRLNSVPKTRHSMFSVPFGGMQRKKSGSSIGSAMTDVTVGAADTLARVHSMDATELKGILLSPSPETSGSDGINNQRNGTLILDIRPSTSFALARIRGSINVCAPSTLLKRSGVSIERIEEELLQNAEDQARFSGWRKGPQRGENGSKTGAASVPADVHTVDCIVVLDMDTRNIGDAGKPSCGGGGPCLTGLLRKFDLAGFDGQLRWLVGGFNDFVRHVESSHNDVDSELIDRSVPLHTSDSTDDELSLNGGLAADATRRASAPDFKALGPAGLRLRPINSARSYSLVQPKGLPMEAFSARSTAQGKAQELLNNNDTQFAMAAGMSQNSEGSSLSAANPFFDNIRQNKELQNGITERIPLAIPDMSESEARRLPGFLAKLRRMPSGQRASSLAQSFFEIEQQERDRLMAVMQRHAEESDCKKQIRDGDSTTGSTALTPKQLLQLSSQHSAVTFGGGGHAASVHSFPFSIAAALERGSENRYNNIWTYEHSRVRCPKSTDYLNGSYVEPARQFGCRRRYIATQAPLPATFDTFWSVMWKQNVRTICMVTREFESGRVQSHNYWSGKKYGTLVLDVIDEVALDAHGNVVRNLMEDSKVDEPGNYFSMSSDPNAATKDNFATIRRRFTLKNQTGEKRMLTQFQYVGWPDYSVPDEADGLLVLMRLANASQHAADQGASERVGPLVVHCSAGVGRTGTYIAIDSALDSIRRARWASAGRPVLEVWDQGWIDVPERGRDRDLSPSQQTQTQVEQFRLAVSSDKGTPSEFGLSMNHRKNLKRELSPSAMDVDSPQRHVGVSGADARVRSSSPLQINDTTAPGSNGRDIDSPPPARRSRPDEAEDALASGGGSSIASSNSSKALANSQSGHLPFSLASADGPQTPSTALSRLSLLSASASTASSASSSSAIGRRRVESNQAGDCDSSGSGSLGDIGNAASHDSSASSGTIATTRISDAPSEDSAERLALMHADMLDTNEGLDVFRKIADTIREQRMSMIQTTRQFVFGYAAVFHGVLEEMRREEAALERRLSSSS